jgi:DHA1 family bicyclomycin/chloramphenicol resistance-like MFS transporter
MPIGWRQVALIGSITIVGPLCIDMYLPALPQITRDLHASASAVQLSLTACLIGIATGQLLFGPVSDRMGRRAPLLAGLTAFTVSSLACAVAPNIYVLTGCRLIQGLGGAAGIVIARSIVRDLYSGAALARFFATLMLAIGVGPILAPQIGSWILDFTDWRGVFVVLAIFGVLLVASAWWRVPETLPPDSRLTGSVGSTLRTMAGLTRDRVYVGYVLACGLAAGGTFAYIAGSSFVLQNIYGLSPTSYGLIFALNACGLIIGAQVSGYLVGRYGGSRLLTAGLVTMIVGGALLFVVVSSRIVGLAGVIPSLWIFMFGFGFVGPNAAALAMQHYPHAAGSAAAVLGSFQFGMAAVIAPLAGVGGTHDATPMITLILAMPIAAVVSRVLLAGRSEPEPSPVDAAE